MKSVTLRYKEGSSDKLYQASIEPKGSLFVVNFAFGRFGSTLNTGTKTNSPVPLPEAEKIFSKLVAEKKAKGYTESESGTPYQHSEKQSSGIQCQLLNAIEETHMNQLLEDDEWYMQEKFDGKRILLQKSGAAINGINRKGLIVGLPSPVTIQLGKVTVDCIIDGESVGDVFHAFDLLTCNGEDIRTKTYNERLVALMNLLAAHQLPGIHMVESAFNATQKAVMLKKLTEAKAEGVVFKRLDAPYTAGRPNSGGAQLKHKFYATLSAVVTKVNQQRSVELGLLHEDGWRTAGNVTIPANHAIPSKAAVVEIRYLYAFKESGCLFQPTYLGPRSDVSQKECTAAQLKHKGSEDE